MAGKPPKQPRQNYEVGKGRPPVATRWKVGQSGNPNGRPKKGTSLDDVVDAVLKQKVAIRERGTVRYMLPGEIMVRHIVADAMKGNLKAFMVLLNLGLAIPRQKEPSKEIDTKNMTVEELAKLYSEIIKKSL